MMNINAQFEQSKYVLGFVGVFAMLAGAYLLAMVTALAA